MSTAIHLGLKEVWRNRTRFLLFSLIVALITVLVLFVAALGTGLLGGISEYFEGLNADLIVYQITAARVASSSRVDCSTRAAIRRVEGVREVGPIGFSSASVLADDGTELLDISLIGVEPGKPGEPLVMAGGGLTRKNTTEAIIDRNVAQVTKLQPGDWLTISSVQGNEEERYSLQVVGISDSLRYSLSPSVFVPIVAWDEVRPKAAPTGAADDPTCNVVAVQLEDPAQRESVQQLIQTQVRDIEAIDRQTAYESLPGYDSIRSSLSTQRNFALLISTLVIGGFFQIQTLQKVPQIGMLKAIGTPNAVVAVAAMIQILITILLGVVIATPVIVVAASFIPPGVPIVFELTSGAIAVGSLSVLGFLGGLVSIHYSLRVEPLIALGLGS